MWRHSSRGGHRVLNKGAEMCSWTSGTERMVVKLRALPTQKFSDYRATSLSLLGVLSSLFTSLSVAAQ